MKQKELLIYLCITVSILNIFAILFSAKSHKTEKVNIPSKVSVNHTPSSSDVYVPNSIELAGETTPIQRNDVKESLKKELIVNTYLHSHTIQILKIAPRVFSIIEPILKAHGVPDDFKYLAVIESKLDLKAISPAGAVGAWQIMKATGKELGLEVTNDIDERYNIERSTEAAAEYLQKAYKKFGTWTLAAAAYNGGSAMIAKQMKIQKEENYYDLLLGEETERYVFRILAMKQIMNSPEKYNFNVKKIFPTEPTQKVEVKGSIKSWAEFAQSQGITYKTLKRFNPWLRKTDLNNSRKKTYQISIPVKKELY